MVNKGFTLIELLGVMIVLSIISLIITPVVYVIINNAKKEAFGNSVYGLVSAGTMYYAENFLYDGKMTSDVEFRIADGNWTSNDVLEVSGSLPKSGVILVNKRGKVALAISNGKWCATKGFLDAILTVLDDNGDCSLPGSSLKYVDPILKGADPELLTGMVPVIISDGTDGNDSGTVIVADIYDDWYDYSLKQWANVILVDDITRQGLIIDDEFVSGKIVAENSILAYLVWIPRYEYKISSSQSTIDVNFKEKNDSTVTNDFIIHPAFTINGTMIDGFWVGKFETGYRQSDFFPGLGATWLSLDSNKNSDESEKILVKPNISSWRGMTSGTAFNIAYNMRNTGDLFGLSSTAETHLMKNTEWGAVAYLSYSNYGIDDEIWINNCYAYIPAGPRYITGMAGNSVSEFHTAGPCNFLTTAVLPDFKYQWNGENGKNASTTGNITGVYDMSGGAAEFVAGVSVMSADATKMYTSDGTAVLGIYVDKFTSLQGTVINGLEVQKYFDVYSYSDNWYIREGRGKIGDATKELGPWSDGTNFASGDAGSATSYNKSSWFSDSAKFISLSNSWFLRGGFFSDSTTSGIFNFDTSNGSGNDIRSFRIVIWP